MGSQWAGEVDVLCLGVRSGLESSEKSVLAGLMVPLTLHRVTLHGDEVTILTVATDRDPCLIMANWANIPYLQKVKFSPPNRLYISFFLYSTGERTKWGTDGSKLPSPSSHTPNHTCSHRI